MSRFDAYAKSLARRDLLKRAGAVAGAAVIGSTLIESVTAPAFAVSGVCTGTNATSTCGGTCPPCPIGQGCAQDVDCEPGLFCNGTCQAAPVPLLTNGNSCLSDRQCASFYCDATLHQCKANPIGGTLPGDPCHAANDAAAGLQCDGFGGTCTDGTCRSGNNGYCRTQDDCATGFICDTEDRNCHYPP